MAWNSQGEEVLEAFTRYVAQLSPHRKTELGHTYDRAVNPFSREWRNFNGLTFVNLQNRKNVWDNLGLGMFVAIEGLLTIGVELFTIGVGASSLLPMLGFPLVFL